MICDYEAHSNVFSSMADSPLGKLPITNIKKNSYMYMKTNHNPLERSKPTRTRRSDQGLILYEPRSKL